MKPKRQFFVKRKEMKKFFCTTILTVLMASAAIAGRQDYPEEYLGLPGDNLNLYAVMNLFQESETLEGFERSLNEENSRVNNLDLNNDGYVDYLSVSDYTSGNVHTIVLRAVLDRNEYQDVAVFTVEQLRNGEVQIQLIGDEALYGQNYIVEPNYAETPNPGYRGRTVARNNVTVVTTTYYEVGAWPVIRYIYSPHYVIWRSNWYWGYYPVYWHPWRPFYWHAYYGYHYNWYPHYYSCYRHWHQPRWNHYHDYYYTSVRAHSPNVSHRITEGTYRQTYSKPETRRDGEALYSSTAGTRSRSAGSQQSGVGSRRSEAPGQQSTQSRNNGNGTGVGSRRSEAPGQQSTQSRTNGNGTGVGSRRSEAPGQQSTQSRTNGNGTGVGSRRSEAPGQQSTQSRTNSTGTGRETAGQGSETRRSATTVKSSKPPVSGSQSTVNRSSQPAGSSRQSGTATQARTQTRTQSAGTTVQRSSQSSAGRSQSTVQRAPSRESVSQRSSSTASRSSSAPAARSQSRSSNSGRSNATVSSRSSNSSSRSSGSPSKSSSRSSSSSKGSDDSSRSSRR